MASPAGQDGEPNKSAVIDPVARSHAPVAGTPGRDREFAISDTYARDGAAFAVADTGVGVSARVQVYRCDTTFRCNERLHAFPKRWTFDRIWLSSDFARTKTIYVSTTPLTGPRALWWSRDAGKTWARWTSAERLLAPVSKAKAYPAYVLGRGPAGSRLLYLRVSYAPVSDAPAAPPAEQLFRSGDNGATWTLLAYGRTASQRGARGTMPTDNPITDLGDGAVPPGALTVAPGGRLFALGRTGSYFGLYCSTDGGRHWARTCR